jgi:hypothetical protein
VQVRSQNGPLSVADWCVFDFDDEQLVLPLAGDTGIKDIKWLELF